ncbi:hypothetical protein PROFUN_14585 [Planoprotostelium fungivorum]|uniref:PAS domain-containing protein n=1 Tax=Planoprotostelium fungivorum TaxID=1890364 RepID=A0A2P6MZM6_9EUKA|nr:hypothetical protein PROFUN_14585 [Planoprotostelium fungivorum]
MREFSTALHQKRNDLLRFMNEDQRQQLVRDFYSTIDIELTNKCCDASVPHIISSHFGIVAYVNNAFRRFTGFDLELPTGAWDHSFLFDIIKFDLNHYELRIWDNKDEMPLNMKENGTGFVEGTLCIALKRDLLRMPMLFCFSFLPSPSVLRGTKSQCI